MTSWYERQNTRLEMPDFAFRAPVGTLKANECPPLDPIEARIAEAAEDLRRLHETGEMDWNNVSALTAYEFAFLD